MASISFSPNPDVERGDVEALRTGEAHEFVRATYLDKDWQKMVRHAFSHWDTSFVVTKRTCQNAFINCVITCFDNHLPLTLRPQHFWLLILQGVASHVEANPEELREKFVNFEGKVDLEMDVTGEAARGFMPHDWEKAVFEFNQMIASKVKSGVYEAISCGSSFSNTLPVEQVASGMTVMDLCKSYFNYKMFTRCGFPKITLQGKLKDWEALYKKARNLVTRFCLPSFSASWWPTLHSVLSRFCLTYQRVKLGEALGAELVRFWEGFAKIDGTKGSGGSTWVSGWINAFFPFINSKTSSPFCVPYNDKILYPRGLDTHQFVSGLSSTPVTLDDHPLEFRSGFLGVMVDEKGEGLQPCVGWYVASGKTKRTAEHFFQVNVKEVDEAKEVLTNIGAKIPLLPFVTKPHAFQRVERERERLVKQEKAKEAEIEIKKIREEIAIIDKRKNELATKLRDLYALVPQAARQYGAGRGFGTGGRQYSMLRT